MRHQLFFIVLAIGVNSLQAQTSWTDNHLFKQKNFIENNGQANNVALPNKEPIYYTAYIDGVTYYFTRNGYTVSRSEKQPKIKNEPERDEDDIDADKRRDEDEFDFSLVEKFHELKWEGANPNVQLIAGNKVKNYYSYSGQGNTGKKGTIIANAYTRLTYKEIYPYTDVVFEFPKDSSGIKYSIYLYPGADIRKIKMSFPNETFKLNKTNDVCIQSAFGTITDHAPASYIASTKTQINSQFKIVNDQVGFELKNVPLDQAVIIDPWTVSPDFDTTGITNSAAYDVDYDDAGNVYVFGSGNSIGGVYTLLKYNASGTLIWTYVSPFSSYGDFAVDRSSNNIYLVQGFNSGTPVVKLNSSATDITAGGSGISPYFTEMWRIAISKCDNRIVIAGGNKDPDTIYQTCTLDTNLIAHNYAKSVPTINCCHDIGLLALDTYGNCYELSNDPGDGVLSNQLIKTPLPSFLPITYNVSTNYSLREVYSIVYYGVYSYNGYNGLTTSGKYVYSYNGYSLKKWDGPTGNLLTYKLIHIPPLDPITAVHDSSIIHWGGICANECGNLFLADSSTVLQFDSTLTLVHSYIMHGVITDINLSIDGNLYVCGLGFVTSLTPTGLLPCYGSSLTLTTTVTDANCTVPGSASAAVNGGTLPYSIVWSTLPVQYGATASDLPPGSYTVTITDATCGRHNRLIDTVTIGASGGAFFSVPVIDPGCPDINEGTIHVTNSGGVSPYTFAWSGTSADTNAIYHLTPGNYSLTVTDNAGCTNVFDSLIVAPPRSLHYSFKSTIKCFNDTATLTISPAGGTAPYAVNWTTPFATGPSVSGIQAGDFAGIITDANGCFLPFDYHLRNPPLFTASSTDSYDCSITNFGSILVTPSGGDAPYSYLWAGYPLVTTNTNSPLAPNIYTVTVRDSNLCSITLTDTIPSYSPVSITGTATSSCVGGASGSITITAAGGAVGFPYQYNWVGYPADNTNILPGIGPGTYSVTVTSDFCSRSATFTVGQLPATVTSLPANICSGQSYMLPSGNLVSSEGTYTDTLHATAGCDSIISTILTVGIPSAGAGTDVTINSGESTMLTSSGGTSYTWSPPTALSCIVCNNPIASPSETTIYCVVIDNGTCIDSACVTVTVETPCPDLTELKLPDAFSPNNDGNNDLFLLQGWNSCAKEFRIVIFDRWGEKVFQSEDVNFTWDGIYKGKTLDPAVFVYYIKATLLNDSRIEREGNITLIR